jgi:hypothetical protein
VHHAVVGAIDGDQARRLKAAVDGELTAMSPCIVPGWERAAGSLSQSATA